MGLLHGGGEVQRLGVEADAEIVEEVRGTLGETWHVVEERGV